MDVASKIHKLLGQKSVKTKAKSCRRIGEEDRISALPNDLLVRILLFVPTKDAVATMILSKRWQFIWTMLPILKYYEYEINDSTHKSLFSRLFGKREQEKSIWRFLNESLRLHKAPVLERLVIELGKHCPLDADVGKWIANAVDRKVSKLGFFLEWSGEPISLPKSLYICDSLVSLTLADKIFVDVPSSVYLPSLKRLVLHSVVYKDEDSLARLLSSCPILNHLVVYRKYQDNVTKVSVNVPSLETLEYFRVLRVDNQEDLGSLVIVSANLKNTRIVDCSGDTYWINNKPCLDRACLCVSSYLNSKFMRSISTVTYLELVLSGQMVECCKTINFFQLRSCNVRPCQFDWSEAFVFLLHNSPQLKILYIDQTSSRTKAFPLSFNQPSSVPVCLSTNLEIFEWKEYGGTRGEKEMVSYILANSKCLKRVGISLKSNCGRYKKKKMMKELKSMVRISKSSNLCFSTRIEFLSPLVP